MIGGGEEDEDDLSVHLPRNFRKKDRAFRLERGVENDYLDGFGAFFHCVLRSTFPGVTASGI